MSPRKARRLDADIRRRPRRAALASGTGGNSKRAGSGAGDQPVTRLGPPQVQDWPDGEWVVRQVPGAAALKTYRCPGCDQEILPGVAHAVVWPVEAPGLEQRRHWHNSCWQRRPRRPGSWLATPW